MDEFYKIDLHTHSIISHDGGIRKIQYRHLLEKKVLDCIAITDHNETSFAKTMHEELGERIIVGEEIESSDGEIIGLFLSKTVPAGLSAEETVNQIKNDGGLVYIPHPFEKARHSLQEDVLKTIIKDVDIIEAFNGRGVFRGKSRLARHIAISENIAMAASSDAHCKIGIGKTFSITKQLPTKDSLKKLLREGKLQKKYAPFVSLFCPAFNKMKNRLILEV